MLIRKTLSWVLCSKILVEWLHFRPLVLISALADCKCYLFYSGGQNTFPRILFFLSPARSEPTGFQIFLIDFLCKPTSLHCKPLCCALRDQTEKSISKSTPASSDQGQGWDVVLPLLLFCDTNCVKCLFIHSFLIVESELNASGLRGFQARI